MEDGEAVEEGLPSASAGARGFQWVHCLLLV